MTSARTYSAQNRDAVRLLGLEIARARRERRWTIPDLGERAGVSDVTVRAAEKGVVTVAIGTVFEIATILGIDLFAERSALTLTPAYDLCPQPRSGTQVARRWPSAGTGSARVGWRCAARPARPTC